MHHESKYSVLTHTLDPWSCVERSNISLNNVTVTGWDLGSKCDKLRCLIISQKFAGPFNRGDTIINTHFTFYLNLFMLFASV